MKQVSVTLPRTVSDFVVSDVTLLWASWPRDLTTDVCIHINSPKTGVFETSVMRCFSGALCPNTHLKSTDIEEPPHLQKRRIHWVRARCLVAVMEASFRIGCFYVSPALLLWGPVSISWTSHFTFVNFYKYPVTQDQWLFTQSIYLKRTDLLCA